MNILVAVDFSDATARVTQEAVRLARPLSATLWLIHVADPDPDFVGYESDPQVLRDVVAQKYHEEHRQLQALGHELRAQGNECVALLVQGATVETLLKEAQKLAADMLVIGSHGKGIFKQMLMGSVSEGVLHQATVPVLMVPVRHA